MLVTRSPSANPILSKQNKVSQRYFLKVLAVTITVNANNTAKGNTTNVGCKLNGKAR